MVERNHPTSLLIVATAMCAALYAIGCYATAYIPSPWGFGQFRPAVVIPAFFAAIFGPFPAALGAAMGTLIADSTKHGCLYMGSLIAAVPGNFIGFYIFGYILRKKFSWTRFISASLITLTVANLIVAFLYVFVFKVLYLQALALPTDALTYLSIGLTIWWFVTMLPFVLLITPLLIRIVAAAFPSLVSDDLRTHALKMELPKLSFSLAMVAPGVIMLLIGVATSFTQLRVYTITFFGEPTALMIELMYYVSGAFLFSIGIIVLATQKLLYGRRENKWKSMKKFITVAVGGTFDEFHKGHRALLLKTFEVGEQVIIGLCSDEFVKKLNKPHETASYGERLEELQGFLRERGFVERAKIIPLNDAYGITLSKGCVQALVVSKETEPTAFEINRKRSALGLAPLEIVVIDMVPSENHISISTTRIRYGEIDREGRLLKQKVNA